MLIRKTTKYIYRYSKTPNLACNDFYFCRKNTVITATGYYFLQALLWHISQLLSQHYCGPLSKALNLPVATWVLSSCPLLLMLSWCHWSVIAKGCRIPHYHVLLCCMYDGLNTQIVCICTIKVVLLLWFFVFFIHF